MNIHTILKNFGLQDKAIAVYLALIELGPSPVRAVSLHSKINRGTTYDILKSLQQEGLVSYFDKASHQCFAAESPEVIVNALERRQTDLEKLKQEVTFNLPELKALFEKEGGKPAVKIYEGEKGIREILEDVLKTLETQNEKQYFVYSSASLRKNVYLAMPNFSSRRVKKNIYVKTIALGEGGKLTGLDERKWMPTGNDTVKATYELIYGGKVAHISLSDSLVSLGVVIQNQAIYETQKMIFEFNWEKI